jgi:hypothetical protein
MDIDDLRITEERSNFHIKISNPALQYRIIRRQMFNRRHLPELRNTGCRRQYKIIINQADIAGQHKTIDDLMYVDIQNTGNH